MKGRPFLRDVKSIAKSILGGGVVVYPTETYYALGAHFMCEAALDRIYRIKLRTYEAPLLCIVDGLSMLQKLVERIPPPAEYLMERFWPGPLTLVLPAKKGLPEALIGPGGGVGVRWSSHALAQALVKEVGSPVVGTSANPSGGPSAILIEEIPHTLLNSVDGVLDGGRLSGGPPSTVLDCTVEPFKILRHGAVNSEELLGVVQLG
ncbi:MAG: L-threonylcarbamoyladenylate synthase [bacterium]